MGWPFDDKDALHKELGPIFTIVTPAGLEITVADPHVTNAVCVKRKEFIKPAVMYDQLNVFGRNPNTVCLFCRARESGTDSLTVLIG